MSRSNSQQPPSNSWDSGSMLPDNTSQTPQINESFGPDPKQQLSGEQMEWLIKRLSTDDQQELGKVLRDCAFEMTTQRGIPVAALLTGAMYVARTRLPENLQFGPKGWPFYALIAAGTITATSALSMNKCGQRVKPKVWQLYQKYTANQPNQATTYESLRAANRQHMAPPQYGISPLEKPPVSEDARNVNPHPPAPKGYLYEEVPTMSGTPFTALPPTEPRERQHRERDNNNSYGDKGFS